MHLLAPEVIFVSSTHYSLIEEIIYHLKKCLQLSIFHLHNWYNKQMLLLL